MSGEGLAAAVEFLGHDEWCDYADKSPEGCEDGFGCGVWRRARRFLGSDWLAKRDAALLAAERERVLTIFAEEHIPWHYTEYGVICSCGSAMDTDETCIANRDLLARIARNA